MSTLTDDKIIKIAETVATSNNVSFAKVRTRPAINSTGAPAIEIKIVLTPGSSAAILGLPSALTTSQLIQQLANEGEERFPIVEYEE